MSEADCPYCRVNVKCPHHAERLPAKAKCKCAACEQEAQETYVLCRECVDSFPYTSDSMPLSAAIFGKHYSGGPKSMFSLLRRRRSFLR